MFFVRTRNPVLCVENMTLRKVINQWSLSMINQCWASAAGGGPTLNSAFPLLSHVVYSVKLDIDVHWDWNVNLLAPM